MNRSVIAALGLVAAVAARGETVPLDEPIPKPYDEQPKTPKSRLVHDSAKDGTYRK